MGGVEFILFIVVAASSIGAGWGYSLVSLPSPNFRAARATFWLSGIGFWSLGIVWAGTAEHLSLWRLAGAALVGAVTAVALAWALHEVRRQENAKMSKPPEKAEASQPTSGSTAIKIDATQGGFHNNKITVQGIYGFDKAFDIAGDVKNNEITTGPIVGKPDVKLKLIEQSAPSHKPDGTLSVTSIVELDSNSPVHELKFETQDAGLIELDVTPLKASGDMNVTKGAGANGMPFVSISNPSGSFRIVARAKPNMPARVRAVAR